ncbi:hypothetical protein GAYE_SCF29G4832 [Galdieria yellowstonensis]|uniref:Transcription initiation factor IIE subunit alpha N-terminal domain-containing protein n=1 Tax=Galdieria yellowstonensis TaxID=3028027 RepID=A0AAV9IHY5_9RHOD|nr:hypothetical protein GAYE_SCF29G4832 [Galdieria yellowstonensis]
MAQVPKQVEDLVRVIARAFYTDLYIVVIDALVREKYIRQDLLSKKLHVPMKELRKLLLKLQEQKLVKCEVRVQRKPAKNSGEYPRAIKATFWYIDYVNLVDMTKYRVDGMRQKVAEMISQGHLHQSFQCQKCKEVYSSLDTARLFVPSQGVLRCDNVILRNTVCNGLVEEVELQGQVASIKELQTRMENELRPILELLAQAEQERVPVHPLEGLDAGQLGTIISENPEEQPSWDMLREELHKNSQASLEDSKDSAQREQDSQVKVEIVAADDATQQGANDTLEEEQQQGGRSHIAPSWFQEKTSEPNLGADNDWTVELEDYSQTPKQQQKEEQVSLLDEEEYSLAYYRSLMEEASDNQTWSQSPTEEESDWLVSSQEPEQSCNILMENGQVVVKVQGQLVPLKDVKETHLKQMTTEEYLAYYETLMQTSKQ